MKIFKNIVTCAMLCTIGSTYPKQTGSRQTQPIIPQPTRPVIQQPSKQIPKETTKPSQIQYFLNKIKDLESTGIATYKIIEEHFADMSLEEQAIIDKASDDMLENIIRQAQKLVDIHRDRKKLLEKAIDNPDKTVKSNEKIVIINQPYMVTEKNKQLMRHNLTIETNIKFKKFTNQNIQSNFNLSDQDLQQLCENIDFILRKANSDYIQVGSTNEEQIANAKMAMDIAEQIIVEQLSQLKTSTLRKLSEYILRSKYSNDRRIENIRKSLPTQS